MRAKCKILKIVLTWRISHSLKYFSKLRWPFCPASLARFKSKYSHVVYRANCWDCDSFYVGKTKRRLHDRKTEHFKALSQGCHASALADHVISTGHNIKSGTILISSLPESPTYSAKLKKLFWSVSWNPHLMKMLIARSYFFINFYW